MTAGAEGHCLTQKLASGSVLPNSFIYLGILKVVLVLDVYQAKMEFQEDPRHLEVGILCSCIGWENDTWLSNAAFKERFSWPKWRTTATAEDKIKDLKQDHMLVPLLAAEKAVRDLRSSEHLKSPDSDEDLREGSGMHQKIGHIQQQESSSILQEPVDALDSRCFVLAAIESSLWKAFGN